MKSALLIALLLSACGAADASYSVKINSIPDELASCPGAVEVAPLPSLRTTADIAKYTFDLEASRERLQDKLKICDDRRAELYRRLKESQ